jgi:hypothetical protein
MKRVLLIHIILVSAVASAQMPQNIIPAFKAKYPGARVNKVKKDKDNYALSFTDSTRKGKAFYNYKGDWLRTETEIKWKAIPDKVKIGLHRTKYADWMVYDGQMIISPMDTTYQIEVNNKNTLDSFGAVVNNSDLYLYLSPRGTLMKEEKVY